MPEFAKIRAAAEKALAEIAAGPHSGLGAVNWGDLRVCEVLWRESEGGDKSYEVLIEEASDNSALGPKIAEAISGIVPEWIEVRTEW